jgi:hypothetical protein
MYKMRKSVVVLAASMGFAGLAQAGLVSEQFDGWTEIAAENKTGSFNKVDPGYGGQDFDAEYLYYTTDGSTLYIGLQTGFDVQDGHLVHNNKDYYAGDLALSVNGGASYDFAVDFGLYTEDYQNDEVGAPHQAGLFGNVAWNNDIHFNAQSSPYAMESGNLLSGLLSNEAGIEEFDVDPTPEGELMQDSYWRYVAFDMASLGVAGQFDLEVHWTMSCGNDAIDGTIEGLSVTVPEPASIALFGLGLLGLGVARRRQAS